MIICSETILNFFLPVEVLYDRRSERFDEFFNKIAEGVPVEKLARLKDYLQGTIVLII